MKQLERDIEMEQGDDYTLDLRKTWLLAKDEEKYDVLPEIWQGKNVADFIDPDIMKKLEELEAEEEARDKAHYYSDSEEDDSEETKKMRKMAAVIRTKRRTITKESGEKRRVEKPRMPRPTKRSFSQAKLEKDITEMGVDVPEEGSHYKRAASRSSSRPAVKRARSASAGTARSKSRPARDQSGLRDNKMVTKVKKIAKKAQKKGITRPRRAREIA